MKRALGGGLCPIPRADSTLVEATGPQLGLAGVHEEAPRRPRGGPRGGSPSIAAVKCSTNGDPPHTHICCGDRSARRAVGRSDPVNVALTHLAEDGATFAGIVPVNVALIPFASEGATFAGIVPVNVGRPAFGAASATFAGVRRAVLTNVAPAG